MKTLVLNGLWKLVSLLTPVLLTLTAVRLLMTPAFLQVEYNLPGFPADPYGFTKEERLYWSGIALEYLLNEAGIEFLADLRFADGTPVYNQRELRHMVDVKDVVQATLRVWYGVLVFFAGVSIFAWRSGRWAEFRVALRQGGLWTVLLLGVILLFVLVSFGVFFVAFHNVFFEPGTWVFHWSDTLIRLFPERFWRDAFLFVGGLAMLGGLILWRWKTE
ncbi:MAG: TIGR01906 family membrane protein [Anaerolineales bacterium]|nr:TIGR01906 family membrane protein [Anaerolineales bacterium]MDW8162362.1 TIGR01906 family membrane protein [Anaerolineales bacterium]